MDMDHYDQNQIRQYREQKKCVTIQVSGRKNADIEARQTNELFAL
jgi:hypothetical protein